MKGQMLKVLWVAVLLNLAFFGCFGAQKADAYWYLGEMYNFPDLKWKTIETEHFVIHYSQQTVFMARKLASVADYYGEKIMAQHDYFLEEKVHIVCRDETEMSNGFAVYSHDWITIWGNALYYRLRGRMDWLPDVFTHEFAHIISLKCNENLYDRSFLMLGLGLFEDGKKNFTLGSVILIGGGDIAPTYWVEGTAEFSTHEAGPNEWTTSRDMLMRMEVLEDYIPSFDLLQMIAGASGWDRERVYNNGYNIGLYLKETYGADTYAKFAQEGGKKWRIHWNSIVKNTLGISAKEMYNNWIEWNKKKYDLQTREIRENLHGGDRENEKVILHKPLWEPWDEMDRNEKIMVGILTKGNRYNIYTSWSPDGKYLTWMNSAGMNMLPITEDELPQYSGIYLTKEEQWDMESDKEGWTGGNTNSSYDWSSDGSKIVFTADSRERWYGREWKIDGWYQNDIIIRTLEYDEEGELEDMKYERITNGMRALDPAFSPDGEKVVFIQQMDSVHRLGILDVKTRRVDWIVDYPDDPQMNGPRWSPDGTKIVFSMFHNHQQDIYTVNPDGTGLAALTMDRAEDRDPRWTADGKSVYYCSDRTGIFNAFKIDLETRELTQLTNVLGGVFNPFITEKGGLLYTYFESAGFKVYYTKKENLYNKVVETFDFDQETALAHANTCEDIGNYETGNPTNPEKYHWYREMQPPWIIPEALIILEGFKAGFEIQVSDYLEKHSFWGGIRYGGEYDIFFEYTNRQWYPTIELGVFEAKRTGDMGFDVNFEGWKTKKFETKSTWKIDWLWANASLPLSPEHSLEFGYERRNLYLRGPENGMHWDRYMYTDYLSAYFTYEGVDHWRGDNDINPHSGYEYGIKFTLGNTDVNPTMNYKDPSGEIINNYGFAEIDVEYTKYFPALPWPLSGWPFDEISGYHRFLDFLKRHNCTAELGFTGGYIDKKVHYQDRLYAGGRIPIYTMGDFSPNIQFAGYPSYSITGETLLILSAAYRFPCPGLGYNGDIDKSFGPFFLDKLWINVFSTVGNAWSYNEDNERAIPFRDTSTNGNKLIADAGVELRLKSWLFNRFRWNNFFRVAYGFHKIKGQGDLDNDGTYFDLWDDDNHPQGKIWDEEAGKEFRFYLGIGAGW
ncbi:hypothetical protein ACFL4G_03320 [Thermodesulfobacteriota bacterium]